MDVKLKKFSLLEPNVKVKAIINIDTPIPIQEKSGILPLEFNTVSNELIDWTITGAAGGVGKLGKNYLKQKTTSIPNGAAGTFISGGDAWLDVLNGITFTTTANTTRIGMLFHIIGNGSVLPTGVGDIMLVEGSAIPTAYDAETNLFTESVMQGCYQTTNDTFVAGTQLLYAGDDGKGGTHNYSSTAEFIQTRCKTYSQRVKPNTTYSVRVFNSSYNNLEVALYLLSEPGAIAPQFVALSGQKSIPDNGTFAANDEQWVGLAYSDYRTVTIGQCPVDTRPMTYDYCESFADLKAGTYKLMIDIWGNIRMSDNITIGFQDYTGCVDDNWNGDQSGINEFFALIKEDDTFAIQKTNILENGISKRSKEAPYPNYYHREFTFTLDNDTKVGLYHKAYYTSTVYAYPPYFRFYIVDSDEEAETFTTTDVSPANMTGYSAWEKYNVSLPINIYCEGQTQTVTFDLGESFLSEEDSISFADSQITIPTYVGTNTISADSTIQPEMYIKYRRF